MGSLPEMTHGGASRRFGALMPRGFITWPMKNVVGWWTPVRQTFASSSSQP
jgi:hypothetical protein